MMSKLLDGLVVAAHTPFHSDFTVNLGAVESLAAWYQRQGLNTVFINGSTGECHSLNPNERRQLAQRWVDVVRSTGLKIVVHVGSNSVEDARALAADAARIGADAISALAPSYYKPADVTGLIQICGRIAGGAPNLPFYYYDIPALTGINLSLPEFLDRSIGTIPNLAGVKFTSADLMTFQLCLRAQNGRFDVPFGCDECLLAALALGATGAVGSSYGLAAPLYQRLWTSFQQGDLTAARDAQFQSVRLIQTLARFGYLGAAKTLLGWLGVPVGPARLPMSTPSTQDQQTLRAALDDIGFFSGFARPNP
jgi:N-acetylneuraminate lyase